MIRKNISLYEEDMKKILPIVERHEGNLSEAMREIIDFTSFMQQKFGSLPEAKKIENKTKGACLPDGMLNWFITHTRECLLDEDVIESLEEIQGIESLSDLVEVVELCFTVAIQIDIDDEQDPSEALVSVTGKKVRTEFVAKLIACFLGEIGYLEVENVCRRGASITVKLKGNGGRKSEDDYKNVRESLLKHFGARHILMAEILNRPQFWNATINATVEWGNMQRYKYPRIYK